MARRVAATLGMAASIILVTGEAANALSAAGRPLAEPSVMMLLGTGLVAIAGFSRRYRR